MAKITIDLLTAALDAAKKDHAEKEAMRKEVSRLKEQLKQAKLEIDVLERCAEMFLDKCDKTFPTNDVGYILMREGFMQAFNIDK